MPYMQYNQVHELMRQSPFILSYSVKYIEFPGNVLTFHIYNRCCAAYLNTYDTIKYKG
jgi:hypothetical protein